MIEKEIRCCTRTEEMRSVRGFSHILWPAFLRDVYGDWSCNFGEMYDFLNQHGYLCK